MQMVKAEQSTTCNGKGSPTIRICLLGQFRVERDGQEISGSAWRLRKARSIVKLLALASGRRIGQEEVIDSLWPDVDPESGQNNFHRTLHAARAALGGGSTILRLDNGILSMPSGDDVWIDVEAFELAAAAARRSGSIAACHEALKHATGELLPEDRYEDWTANRRESLRTSELSLRVQLAGLHEARGEDAAAESVLRTVLAIEPFHEDGVRGLMRSLARSGQPHQALIEYRRLVTALAEELDAAPEDASTTLANDIEAGRYPGRIDVSVRRFVLSPLPTERTSLLGRDREVTEVTDILTTTRMLTLTGPGGVGKTRLALRIAATISSAFRDGVAYIPLDLATDASGVITAIAGALGVREDAGLRLLEAVIERLKHAELLLVLDNFEHVLAAATDVATLLDRCPNVTVLATSREPLRLVREREYALLPLETDHPSDADASESPAVALFVERAQAIRPDFRLTDDDAEVVLELCRRIDGLPLAIELAAARVRMMAPQAILARLADRLTLLTGGARDLPERQQTLRAAIGWSYDLLDEEEQAFLRRIAVTSGGCTIETAAELHRALGGNPEQALDLATSLVERNLLRQDEGGGEPRLTMLETIRAFAIEQLRHYHEESTARQAHAVWFTRLAEAAAVDASGPKQAARLAQIDAEHANLRATLDWSIANDPPLAYRLAGVLWRYWYARGFLSEGRLRIASILEIDTGDSATKAHVLHGAGVLAQAQGDYQQAERFLNVALESATSVGDSALVALTLNHLGVVARDQSDYTAATRLIEDSLAQFRSMSNDWGVALSLNNLGVIAQRQRDHPRAAALFEESLHLFRATGDRWGAAIPLNNLGQVALERGNLDLASNALSETLALYRELGDVRHIAITLTKLALVAEARGEVSEAGRLCRESLRLRRDLGDKDGIITAFERLAGVATLTDNARRAVTLLAAAAAQRESIGAPASPDETHYIEKVYDRAVAKLDSHVIEQASTTGRLLSLEQAIDVALQNDIPND